MKERKPVKRKLMQHSLTALTAATAILCNSCATAQPSSGAATSTKPNVVFILADTLAPTTSAMFIGLLVGFALRAAAIHFNLRGPAPRTSRRGDP